MISVVDFDFNVVANPQQGIYPVSAPCPDLIARNGTAHFFSRDQEKLRCRQSLPNPFSGLHRPSWTPASAIGQKAFHATLEIVALPREGVDVQARFHGGRYRWSQLSFLQIMIT
jgi:hypothetical protein